MKTPGALPDTDGPVRLTAEQADRVVGGGYTIGRGIFGWVVEWDDGTAIGGFGSYEQALGYAQQWEWRHQ